MSIRQVTCPSCGTVANAPAAMTNVKCPACGTVWNVNNPAAAAPKKPVEKPGEKPAEKEKQDSTQMAAMIAAVVGGVIMLLVMAVLVLVVLNRDPPPSQASAEVEDTIKPAVPEEYREINKPEETRKRIYADYRTVARTTVEKPLALPQGKIRKNMEDMLQKTFDRELARFAAAHDITVDDVHEVIKEGDAKAWDDRPRSNAVRDGKRVYPKEMSEGWELNNKNRKP